MADEILVDLNDVFEMVSGLYPEDGSIVDHAPVLQVLATIALCERLDVMNVHLGNIAHEVALIDGNLATMNSMRA